MVVGPRKRVIPMIWILSLMAAIAGASFLVTGYVAYRRDVRAIHRLFRAHVDSVALSIKEGAREAAAATSLIYELTEQHLITASKLVRPADPLQPRQGERADLAVSLAEGEGGTFDGDWGPVPAGSRASFIEWMTESPSGILVDDGPAGKLDLACILHSHPQDTAAIVCRDAEELNMLRREIGIGPLLKGVIQKDVLYAALQDADGLLAVAPSPALLSSWDEDATLKKALDSDNAAGVTRIRLKDNFSIYEGIIPFEMADESVVLLRVGIDASTLHEVTGGAHRRFIVMVVLVGGILILIVLLTGLFSRWQRRNQEMTRRMAEQDEDRKHWETIGHMAATVAHEVRNPLNTIGMIAQRLRGELTIAEGERGEFDELIETLQSESARVGRVVTGFLDLGKPLHLTPEKVDISNALERAILPFQMRAERERKQVTLVNGCTGEIRLDSDRFRQVLVNLIENALDAVDEKGTVTVKAAPLSDGTKIEVIDDGLGLSEEQLKEVMNPFVSFKASGTGLGLPLCKRIAEAHGGSLTLTANETKGMTATLIIRDLPEEERE